MACAGDLGSKTLHAPSTSHEEHQGKNSSDDVASLNDVVACLRSF